MVSDAVDRATEMTGPQLTRHVRATLIAADPAVAEQRRWWSASGAGCSWSWRPTRWPA